VLVTSAQTPARIAAAIEAAVERELGFATHAIVRTGPDLAALTAAVDDPDTKKYMFGFCKSKPTAAAAKALAARAFGRDHATVVGADLVLFYADGQGRSKMSGAVLERMVGVPITVRNWNVTRELAHLLQG